MATTPVDVIVSDMMMPGMDGAQLLDRGDEAPSQHRSPGAFRPRRPEAVLRLVGPAHQYLSKPCDAEELRAAIVRTLAVARFARQ